MKTILAVFCLWPLALCGQTIPKEMQARVDSVQRMEAIAKQERERLKNLKPLPVEQTRAALVKPEAAPAPSVRTPKQERARLILGYEPSASVEEAAPVFIKQPPLVPVPRPVNVMPDPPKPAPAPKVVPPEMRLSYFEWQDLLQKNIAPEKELYYRGEITSTDLFEWEQAVRKVILKKHGEPLPIRPFPTRPSTRPTRSEDDYRTDMIIDAIEANTRAVQQSGRGCR